MQTHTGASSNHVYNHDGVQERLVLTYSVIIVLLALIIRLFRLGVS